MDNSIVVVGSVAFDSIETAHGNTDHALGGSAVYFSVAASSFTTVRLVGVAGDDFGEDNLKRLTARAIDVSGLEIVKGGKTFHWQGSYDKDYNEATTKKTELNVFETFKPSLSDVHRRGANLFLANIDPELQMGVLRQVDKPRLVACDTMNFWISGKRAQLVELLKHVNILFINETEVRMLTGEHNLMVAGRLAQKLGPEVVIVKRGASGATLFKGEDCITFPACPVEKVVDPTGAGDSFGGGFMGYISTAADWRSLNAIKRAMAYGTVVSSFDVESFSINALCGLTKADVDRRFNQYVQSLRID